jgi:hypothetical protein
MLQQGHTGVPGDMPPGVWGLRPVVTLGIHTCCCARLAAVSCYGCAELTVCRAYEGVQQSFARAMHTQKAGIVGFQRH